MNTLVKAPRLTAESVLALVKAAGRSGTTLPLLAGDLDVAPTSFTLRRVAFELADRKLIRVVERMGEDDLLVPTTRKASR